MLDKENGFGYDAEGNPITDKDYKKGLDKINAEIDNGTAQLFNTDEVRKRMADDNRPAH